MFLKLARPSRQSYVFSIPDIVNYDVSTRWRLAQNKLEGKMTLLAHSMNTMETRSKRHQGNAKICPEFWTILILKLIFIYWAYWIGQGLSWLSLTSRLPLFLRWSWKRVSMYAEISYVTCITIYTRRRYIYAKYAICYPCLIVARPLKHDPGHVSQTSSILVLYTVKHICGLTKWQVPIIAA